jgi:serine/threonine protein kinase/Flp pilus assembly protein TadD
MYPSDQAESDWARVATIIDRFEDARGVSLAAELGEFLPPQEDPSYAYLAAELVRVDLEYHWEEGNPKPLSEYRPEVPVLFADTGALAGVAFEEYRLRRQSGEEVKPEEYVTHYGVDVEAWPVVSARQETATRDSDWELNDSDTRADGAFPQPGGQFAGFRLVREIGHGAFARVFLASQNDLAKRPVVLKISRRRSLEPEHLARLQHTNIVPIYSVHEADGLIAVCMPYCGDKTLADFARSLADQSSPPGEEAALVSTLGPANVETICPSNTTPETARAALSEVDEAPLAPDAHDASVEGIVGLIRGVALGLSHAHARGIVHRDLKPANILLADDGRPMLLDFNLSEEAAVNGAASLTIGGTLPYMAPEHLRAVLSGGEVDPTADLYSLGVILFELLTGRRPFPAYRGGVEEIIQQSCADRTEKVPSAQTLKPSVSPSLDALIQKCLSPDARQRYRSADDLADDLGRHLEDLPLLHAQNPSLIERATKWLRRHPRLTSAGSVGVVSAMLFLAFAGLWMARANRIASLEAAQHYSDFRGELPAARMALSLPDSDRLLLEDGLATVDNTLARYLTTGNWQDEPRYARLSGKQQSQLREQLAELEYLRSRAEGILAMGAADAGEKNHRLESALRHNRAASDSLGADSIAMAKQRRELLRRLGRGDESAVLPTGDVRGGPLDDYLAAQQLLAEKRFAPAAELLQTLRARHPTDPVVWLLLGNALGGLGQNADADAALTTAAALEPRSYVALFNRGLCRLQQGKALAGAADFDGVLAMHPGLICALLNRALAYEAAGEMALALADLDTAIASGDAPPRALLLRSRIRLRIGDAKGAEADRSAGIAVPPRDEVGWVARGVARLSDEPEAALADFHRALDLNLGSVLALKNIVHVTADRLDRPEEAMAALDAWLEIEPANAQALVGRGVLHARLGDRDMALADVKSALGVSQDPTVLFQAACAYCLTGSREKRDLSRGLALLSAAVDGDARLLIRATTDPDLTAVREIEQYQQLLKTYRQLGELKRDLNKPASATSREEASGPAE